MSERVRALMLENLQTRRPRLSLAVWLVGALTVAMLPLGLISVSQTSKVLQETERLSGVALMDRTQRAASRTQALIQSAFGTAHAIAAANVLFERGDLGCDAVLDRLVEDNDNYVFAGSIDSAGTFNCASDGSRINIASSDYFQGLLSDPEPRVETWTSRALNNQRVLRVSVPVFEDARLKGFVIISIPYAIAYFSLDDQGASVDLMVFDTKGNFLTAEAADRETGEEPKSYEQVLPLGITLEELTNRGRQAFRGENRLGETRDFAVVPAVQGHVFVLGSWAPDGTSLLPTTNQAMALYFPVLMWGAGIIVAYFAVHRLVIRHVKRLQSWMRLYASGRDLQSARLDHAPEELEVVAEAFRTMTRRLAEQERELEDDLAEKTMLLKEVHHRVKNNLQLITSIMNMQIRNARSDEARTLLKRVQDRVMALAAIHRYLYMARKLSMVRADRLLEDIIAQLVVVGNIDGDGNHVKIATQFQPVEINPDQSVPLSLLVAEAAINAVKYCGSPATGHPWITIALQDLGDNRLCLSVVNSKAAGASPLIENGMESSGLGQTLIKSFASQLDGELEILDEADRYELHVTFTPLAPSPDEDQVDPTEEAGT